jgi:hypothetical protein
MRLLAQQNRRVAAWLVAISIFLMGTAANATWLCLDGSPCLPGCAHGPHEAGVAPTAAGVQEDGPRCGRCPSTSVRPTQASGTLNAEPSSGCRLSAAPAPDSALRDGPAAHADTSALLPVSFAVMPASRPSISFLPAAPATGPPPSSPHSGRAPPARLLG